MSGHEEVRDGFCGGSAPKGERARGKCEICGEKGRELRPMFVGEIVLACDACRRQLAECQQRRYCGAGEETEPAE